MNKEIEMLFEDKGFYTVNVVGKVIKISDLQELVNKATPMKALYVNKNLEDLSPTTTWQCPICGKSGYTEMSYSPCCGQKLDWSDTK